MSKSKKKKRDFANEAVVENRPFAALGDLRISLPDAVETAAPIATSNDKPPEAGWKSAHIILQREKKGRGGKTVVRIKGIKLSPDALQQLLKRIKSDLGCGGTIDEGEPLVLGDVSDRLVDWFNKEGARRVSRGN